MGGADPAARSALTISLTSTATVLFTLATFLAARPAQAAGKDLDGVINLNTATPELLALLPGIGPSKARGILSYRARRPFRTVDELVRVKGIGRRMVRAMRAHLAVSGPSTARGLTIVPTGMAGPPAPPAPVRSAPAVVCRPGATPIVTKLGSRPRGSQHQPPRSAANHCLVPP